MDSGKITASETDGGERLLSGRSHKSEDSARRDVLEFPRSAIVLGPGQWENAHGGVPEGWFSGFPLPRIGFLGQFLTRANWFPPADSPQRPRAHLVLNATPHEEGPMDEIVEVLAKACPGDALHCYPVPISPGFGEDRPPPKASLLLRVDRSEADSSDAHPVSWALAHSQLHPDTLCKVIASISLKSDTGLYPWLKHELALLRPDAIHLEWWSDVSPDAAQRMASEAMDDFRSALQRDPDFLLSSRKGKDQDPEWAVSPGPGSWFRKHPAFPKKDR